LLALLLQRRLQELRCPALPLPTEEAAHE
jgi:hypothetical protein